MEKILPMIRTSPHIDKIKQIYQKFPHSTSDNYFSEHKIMECMRRKGFGAIRTCRQDLLPADSQAKNFYKKKTATSKRTKVARLFEYTVCVNILLVFATMLLTNMFIFRCSIYCHVIFHE